MFSAMKHLLIVILLTIYSFSLTAQTDLLVMKKGGQTIQTWVPGSYIRFQFSSKQWIEGLIKVIRNDSITVDQIALYKVPTITGFPRIDTAHMGLLKLHVREIYGMPKRNYGSAIFSNGALLKLGSGAFIFLNIVNSLIRNEAVFSSTNLNRLGVAGGVFVTGMVLSSFHKTYITLGKKYTLKTINTQ